MTSHHDRAGFTLLELIVVVTVIAILFGVAGGAIASAFSVEVDRTGWLARLEAARARAVVEGRAVVAWPDSAHVDAPVLFLPDGRVVGLDGDASP
jgi:prepilin-type N-terminal cleavage/methylation domain-containing protein